MRYKTKRNWRRKAELYRMMWVRQRRKRLELLADTRAFTPDWNWPKVADWPYSDTGAGAGGEESGNVSVGFGCV